MKIIFVVPSAGNKPSGGMKIIYEYANMLVGKYAEVSILYDCRKLGITKSNKYHIPEIMRKVIVGFIGWYRSRKYPTWFALDEKINKRNIFSMKDNVDGDVIFATAYSTVDFVLSSKIKNKLYLIQGFENWDGTSESELIKSYKSGLKNIVVSKWLENILKNNGAMCRYISNGLNYDVFNINIPINKRGNTVAMLYHSGIYKGSIYGIRAILKVKEKVPELKAILFGTPARPDWLPAWIEYIQSASENEVIKIYNNASIYLYPSIEEGFGLTCIESMACGCALVATDYPAIHEFAINNENCVLSPIKDSNTLADNILKLINDREKRESIAKCGNLWIKAKYNWNDSISKIIDYIEC